MTHHEDRTQPVTTGARPRVVVFWDQSVVERPLPDRGVLTIGRGLDCDVRIEHASVSRLHARLHVGPGWSVAIEDAGSSNGLQVRGRRLASGERVALLPDEPVVFGSATLVLQGVPREAPAGPPSSRDDRGLLEVVSESHLNVLIVGETGVGKEVKAREIHARSPRANGPFVGVNCAAFTEPLFESELFGHERGAFTGAVQRKLGLLEAAHGGTLFLDEIGELTLASQAKLLRVIETGEVMRVGAVRPTQVDVRFLGATNRDLRAMCTLGTFREDLYYRLNGMTITIPPLRDRRGEIRSLAFHLASRAAAGRGGVPRGTTPEIREETLRALERHDWPGNVRQLRNVIERAMLLARGGPIEVHHLLFDEEPELARFAVTPPSGVSLPPPPPSTDAVAPASSPSLLPDELAAMERRRIVEALEKCAGNQSRAAELLGVTRRVLQRRIEQYGLPRPRKP